ncbi:hypothetical protein [Azospira sp. I09]|uniref:hypothetical protein n=1 Tax=Azospira sp. I09 TaxID=1765049 RepID=UPI0012604D90|nr:hypothetical protein [Azospira sp. I09]BBN90472.1 hypothetical protein AZSP09_34950 [Azospira sp. I09]
MTPNWQPIEALPLIAGMLDDQLHSLHTQVGNLEQCRHRPWVLDGETVNRLQAVFGEQMDSLPVFREQLARWLELPLDEHQRQEINRLNAVLDQMKAAIERILSLAGNIR